MKFDSVLLASDYDGTLYDENGIITPQVREAIAYFIANGGRFTVCTGRTRQGFHAYERSYINAPVLLANGAMAYDYEKGETVFEIPLRDEVLDAVCGVRDNFPAVSIEMYPRDNAYVINLSDTSHRHLSGQDIHYDVITEPLRASLPWMKVMIYASEQSLAVQDYLKKEFPTVHFLPTAGAYIEIMQNGVDKGTGLFRLADEMNIPHENCFAVGDGFNDIEMLVAARLGFVPSNGSSEALAVADRVVRPNTDGAVANVIELLGEIF